MSSGFVNLTNLLDNELKGVFAGSACVGSGYPLHEFV